VILLDNLPAPPLGDLAQGGDLVLDRLLVGRYADVNCGTLLHDSPPMLSASCRKGIGAKCVIDLQVFFRGRFEGISV
jgi:hypothetical protein